jgi:hypothetical protein
MVATLKRSLSAKAARAVSHQACPVPAGIDHKNIVPLSPNPPKDAVADDLFHRPVGACDHEACACASSEARGGSAAARRPISGRPSSGPARASSGPGGGPALDLATLSHRRPQQSRAPEAESNSIARSRSRLGPKGDQVVRVREKGCNFNAKPSACGGGCPLHISFNLFICIIILPM